MGFHVDTSELGSLGTTLTSEKQRGVECCSPKKTKVHAQIFPMPLMESGKKKPATEKDESCTERTDTQAPFAYR